MVGVSLILCEKYLNAETNLFMSVLSYFSVLYYSVLREKYLLQFIEDHGAWGTFKHLLSHFLAFDKEIIHSYYCRGSIGFSISVRKS